MIELKLQIWGGTQMRLTAEYLAKMADADDEFESDDAAATEATTPPVEETVKRVVEEAQADEPAPKKRRRPRKEDAQSTATVPDAVMTNAPETVANISETPEDRRDPAQDVEEAEVVEETKPATEMDLRAALSELVEQVGMAEAMTWVKANTGYSKMSEIAAGVAEGKTSFATIVAAINAKVAE